MEFLTVEEVAERLRIKPTTIYSHCRKGDFPHVRIGGSVRIPSDKLEDWLIKNTIQPEEREEVAA